MSIFPDGELPQPLRRPHRFPTRRITVFRCSAITRRSSGYKSIDDPAFWDHLEAREEGRLAQEADHLFDTSAPWAI